MLEADDIRNKVRVVLNESSSDHARSEAASALVSDALISLGRIACALEALIKSVDRK